MKGTIMKNRFLAAVMVAVFLSVVTTKGIDFRLPPTAVWIGSQSAMKEGAVTNVFQKTYGTVLYFTNKSGISDSKPLVTTSTNVFPSFAAYKAFAISNAYVLFNQWSTNMDPSKVLRSRSYVGYSIPSGNFLSLLCDIKVGPVSAVTSNTFIAALDLTNVQAVIPVPGLIKYTMVVPGLYTNTWPPQQVFDSQHPPAGFTPPEFPPELTTTDVVVIDPLWATGAFDLRITIATASKTTTFTQFGSSLDVRPVASMTRSNLSASFPRGAHVTIESSPNLCDWTPITSFSDLGGLGFISLTYAKDQPCQFFRVGAQ
jgi:hypothetical protein